MTAAKLAAAITAGLAGLIATQAAAQVVSFYEENNCRKLVFKYTGPHRVQESCKGGPSACRNRNDTARSVRVVQPAWMGLRLIVHDDPYGGSGDDWATIIVNGNRTPGARDTNICIPSFERNLNTAAYSIKYGRRNGLDGKVSHILKESLGRYNETLP